MPFFRKLATTCPAVHMACWFSSSHSCHRGIISLIPEPAQAGSAVRRLVGQEFGPVVIRCVDEAPESGARIVRSRGVRELEVGAAQYSPATRDGPSEHRMTARRSRVDSASLGRRETPAWSPPSPEAASAAPRAAAIEAREKIPA